MSPDTSPETSLSRQQAIFAAHLRDPQRNAAPPAADERIAVYRELFFNNVRDLLAGNFPMLRRLLGRHGWERLIRDFYREHRSATPLFPELGREFLDWLTQSHAADDICDASAGTSTESTSAAPEPPVWPPFLQELAHYEWIELALALDETDLSRIDTNPGGDLLHDIPVVSPLAWPLAYRFPVHRISLDHQPDTAPSSPTFLMIRRDAQHTIHFHEIDALTHALLHALHDNSPGATGTMLIEQLTAGQPDAAALHEQARTRLTALHERNAILGTRPSQE